MGLGVVHRLAPREHRLDERGVDALREGRRHGSVYPARRIQALVVVMRRALGGGATNTLRLDQTGKSLGHALLRLPVSESVA